MLTIAVDENILECSLSPSKRKGSEYTKFEAWFYLVLHVELEGGILSVQLLSLAKEWNWSRTKVRNFLLSLEQENRIKFVKKYDIFLISREEINIKKDTKKDTKKDIKKYTPCIDGFNIYSKTKNTKKDTEKNIKKYTEKNTKKDTLNNIETNSFSVDVNAILDIIKM